jgi:hypothetical protein
MSQSGSRRIWRALGVLIVMVEAGIPQRAFAQWRTATLPGLRFGPPLRAGLAVGVGFGNRTAATQFAGPLVLGEVAVGGGRVSAGYFFAGPFASGIELLGSAIRTWGSPSQLERRTTIAGGELRASFFLVNVGAGVFRPVGGFDGDRRTRYYLNVGLGI